MTCSKTLVFLALVAFAALLASPLGAQPAKPATAPGSGSGSGSATVAGSGSGSGSAVLDPTTEMEKFGHKVRATVELDGKQCEVVLKAEKKAPEGETTIFHLVVLGPDKKPIWEDTKLETTFGMGDAGVESLQVVGDVDADKQVEIISPSMQSDVSPVTFRVLRWTKGHFEKARGGLLIGNQPVPTEFNWTDKEPAPETPSVWVLYFEKIEEPGLLQAYIAQSGEAKLPGERAMLRATDKGYKVEKWLPGDK